MTREEAIELIHDIQTDAVYSILPEEKEALDMAIECLSAQNKAMTEEELAEFKKELANAVPERENIEKIKAEIKEKCDEINYIVSDLPYSKHRAIQELLCEILDNIGKESEE